VAADERPVTFDADALYDEVNSVHNIFVNAETDYAYLVGSSGGGKTCGGGLHMVNVEDPLNPTFEGCFTDPSTGRSGTGATHDVQCVVYEGPDANYQGREICVGSNETAISIADVTNKDSTARVATASYPDHAYVHQGWFGENQRYFYLNDELDEVQGKVDGTRTLVWDLKDLDNPQLVNEVILDQKATDHNMYVEGGRLYEANYTAGLRILDLSDPTNPTETAHFDTKPRGPNDPGFAGAWSNYPFFESGIVVVSSIDEGLFVLEKPKQGL
jgi:choice-of-anchor B domain-containing protein